MFLYLSPLCVKWRQQHSPSQSVAVLPWQSLWSLLAQHVQVSQSLLEHIPGVCHWHKLSPAAGAAEQVYSGMERRGWSRMFLVSGGFFLPRTHWVDGDRLGQSCSPEFSWSLSCEAEPCCKGTGYLQLKYVWKVLQGLHLCPPCPFSHDQLSVQCWGWGQLLIRCIWNPTSDLSGSQTAAQGLCC